MIMPTLSDYELGTLPGLRRAAAHIKPQFAFRAESREQAEAWQTELRETLTRLLGLPEMERCPLDTQLISETAEDGYRRQLIVLQTAPGEFMPCYVLIPDAVPPFQTVIALHGHGSLGARGIIGLAENPSEQAFIEQHHYDFALSFVKRGYLVFAPVQRGFAQRMERVIGLTDADMPIESMWQSSCLEVSLNALLCGKTLLGMRVWDVMRLLDYIQTRPEADPQSLLCVGFSGGGTAALFTTALEPRITGAVVSGYLNTFIDSILAVPHCACNYVPGLLQYAEMTDVAGLVAPRSLLTESGTQDENFPVEGTRRALAALQAIYQVMDAKQNLHTHIFEGGHRWDGGALDGWLVNFANKTNG